MIENPRLVKMWEVTHIVKHMTFAQLNNLSCSFFVVYRITGVYSTTLVILALDDSLWSTLSV